MAAISPAHGAAADPRPDGRQQPRRRRFAHTRADAGERARLRDATFALGAFVGLYLSWQLTGWIPGDGEGVGDLLLLPIDAAAVYAAWSASRRCAAIAPLRSFWRLLAIALAAETLGDLVHAVYTLGLHESPYPSLADPFYLAFYPLLLLALLRVPVAPATRPKLLRTLLDGATIVVGGGAVVWYLVLGPTALEAGQSPLAMAVSVAFPIGDLFLLSGLALVLLRQSPAALRTPVRLVTVAVTLGVVADVLYGYGQLHGVYSAGDWIDTLYVLEFATFALAGFSQRVMVPDDPSAVAEDRRGGSRASWLPYLSLAIGLGVLLGVERGNSFFPDLSLVLIVIVLAVLVAVRQYVAQRELVQAQAALRTGERMKDEFLSIVGHELRTPLTSIRGSLGLLEAGVLGELPEDAANMVSVAVVNTDRLVRLIGDILDIERMAAGGLLLEPVAVPADELVSQSIQVLQASADAAGVMLRAEAVAPIGVMADPDRIVQVLVNLLGNAVKFSPRGGVVSIAVTRDHRCAIFSVTDAGRGIPAERLEGIFERFRQVDASDAREKGGAGLGLPIARGIVERHGGRIWAESGAGRGSVFRFTLPVAVAELEPTARSGAA
jgi:signal transduction histidine kinase